MIISKKIIILHHLVGNFAEDKDIARKIRLEMIQPILNKGDDVEIDFENVEDATQSFIHALLSELIRNTQGEALDHIDFKNCNDTVKTIINMVVDYMVGN